MASVNKVTLVGNAGRDPEIRYMPNGKAICNLSIATSSKRKDKSGEVIEQTEWHRVVFYDKLAEIVGEYVKKGKPLYVEGRLKYGTYTDKTSGVEKNTCDIVATEMQLLGGRDDGGQSRAPAPRPPEPQRQAPAPASAARGAAPSSGFDDMDDDIPFISCDFKHDLMTPKEKRIRSYDF